MVPVEAVYAASFSLLAPLLVANGGSFVTVSRRLKLVEDVDPSSMPAVYQLQTSMTPALESFGGVTGWLYNAEWYVYVDAGNDTVASTPLMNPRVTDLLNVLPQEAGTALQFQVAGATCMLAIGGMVEFFEGLLGQKSVAKIPIRITVMN